MKTKQRIWQFSKREGYKKMYEICNVIYIARNITLDNTQIQEQLKEIDKLFAENNFGT